MGGIMKRIILLNYSLSIFLSRGRTDLVKNGTWFLFANELFFILLSLIVIILTRFEFRLSQGILLFLLIAIWGISFYGTRSWLIGQIAKKGIVTKYKTLQPKAALITVMGAMFFLSSFLLFLFTIIKTFEGYLNL
ncbi:MAG: hypothetical protein Q8O72_10960 [Bacteroidales bacterium]|nr:hypothetical protein [Bacteroidales bacterium]